MARVVLFGLAMTVAQPASAQQAGGGRGGPGGPGGGGGGPGGTEGPGGSGLSSGGPGSTGGGVGPPPGSFSGVGPSGNADQDTVRDAVANGRSVPYPQVLAAVESAVSGQVVGVSLSGRPPLAYRVKVLTDDGSLHEVTVDARTGALLAVR